MRNKENGNCLPNGGFCLAVHDEQCEALHNAYRKGWNECYKEYMAYVRSKNEINKDKARKQNEQ